MSRFVEIERPSQQYKADEIAGLYTHILVSLQQHDKRDTEYTPEEREQAKRARDLAARAKEVQKVTRRLWR